MSFDYDAFLADVLKNVPEDKQEAVKEALALEPLKTEISAGYSRQSDYSRNMDELRAAREAAERETQQAQQALEAEKRRYTEWYTDANQQFQALKAERDAYEREYGTLDGFQPSSQADPNQQGAQSMTQEEYERRMAEEFEKRDRLAIQFADTLTDLKLEHRDQFSERLDTDELFKHVEATGLPLKQAYKDWISDRVEAAQKEKFEEQLKQAREEARREALQEAQIPVRADVPNLAQQGLGGDQPSSSGDRVSAAAAAWRQASTA